jgi:hypothetical protein
MVPAAVSDTDGWMTIYENPKQLIRGGSLPSNAITLKAKTVRTVDVAAWLLKLPEDAHVFLKMDIEGAEHGLIRRMQLLGSHKRISRLSIECHQSKLHTCKDTMNIINSWNVTVITEEMHDGIDRRAEQHLQRSLSRNCGCGVDMPYEV